MKTRITAILIMSAYCHLVLAASPKKGDDYRPFSITSQILKTEMSDEYIIEKLMCKTTSSTLAETADLFQNYDLISSNTTDGTIAATTFKGKQDGKDVEVTLLVDTTTNTLSYIWVSGKTALTCW